MLSIILKLIITSVLIEAFAFQSYLFFTAEMFGHYFQALGVPLV